MVDKEYPKKITYVKPAVLDLGAIEIVYGICDAKGSNPSDADPNCTNGDAPGGDCESGGSPAT